MKKYLIINGDDFGLSPSINQSIIEAHEKGILTSASLMVSGKSCTEAINLAKDHPSLSVGLHLVLVCGQSVLSPQEIPNLVDHAGNFLDDPMRAGLNYQFNQAARKELSLEIRAQLEKFQETGLLMSHLDGHLHLHSHPVILGIINNLAAEFQIKIVRLPKEELRFTLDIDRSHFFTKVIWSSVFRQLRRYGEKLLTTQKIIFTDRVYGLLATGKISEDYLLQLIPKIQANFTEIYSHPDHSLTSGSLELKALLSSKVLNCLEENKFELINFHQLEKIIKA